MDLGLKGKVVFISGSSRGLGFATALAFAQEGANVVINSRNKTSLIAAAQKIGNETKAKILSLDGDVSLPGIPQSLIDKTLEHFGKLDILITNTGGPPSGSFEKMDDTDWQKAIDLNFMSHVRLIRAALPSLKTSEAASVLAVTSYSVKQPVENLILSNSVRLAVIGMVKSLALELGNIGIRFNSILPAWIETERIIHLLNSRAKNNGTSFEEEFRNQAAESPFGRMGKPEEFARAAVFISSPAASFITGMMLTVDGGMYKGTF
jgi:3-oxoacyl-[acyl-carrier protein] reductase